MKKSFWGFTLLLAMLFVISPFFSSKVNAATETDYRLTVNGVKITDSNKNDVLGDGTVSYVPAADSTSRPVLKLNNATITKVGSGVIDDDETTHFGGIEIDRFELEINLTGTNTISIANKTSNSYSIAIGGFGDDIYFTGKGTLSAPDGFFMNVCSVYMNGGTVEAPISNIYHLYYADGSLITYANTNGSGNLLSSALDFDSSYDKSKFRVYASNDKSGSDLFGLTYNEYKNYTPVGGLGINYAIFTQVVTGAKVLGKEVTAYNANDILGDGSMYCDYDYGAFFITKNLTLNGTEPFISGITKTDYNSLMVYFDTGCTTINSTITNKLFVADNISISAYKGDLIINAADTIAVANGSDSPSVNLNSIGDIKLSVDNNTGGATPPVYGTPILSGDYRIQIVAGKNIALNNKTGYLCKSSLSYFVCDNAWKSIELKCNDAENYAFSGMFSVGASGYDLEVVNESSGIAKDEVQLPNAGSINIRSGGAVACSIFDQNACLNATQSGNVAGNVTVTAENNANIGCLQYVYGKDITLTGKTSGAPLANTPSAGLNIYASGNIYLENKGAGAVNQGKNIIKSSGGNITVKANSPYSSMLTNETTLSAENGSITLQCAANSITSSTLTIEKSKAVTITGKSSSMPLLPGKMDITSSGDVKIVNESSYPAVGLGGVAKANKLTITAKGTGIAGQGDLDFTGKELIIEDFASTRLYQGTVKFTPSVSSDLILVYSGKGITDIKNATLDKKLTESTCSINVVTEYGDAQALRIVAHNHSYKTITTAATLTKNGSSKSQCSVCNAEKDKKTIYKPASFSLSTVVYVYNAKTKTPAVTVKDSNKKALVKNTDYTVTYPSGRTSVGAYNITVKGKGKYNFTKTLTFKINPVATTISSVTATSKGFKVAWKKPGAANLKQITGYQVQYSTSSKFASAKTVTISKNSTVSQSISKLKGKQKYYVRVRTYRKVNKVNYYSAWSPSKYVTTKK